MQIKRDAGEKANNASLFGSEFDAASFKSIFYLKIY
jgi:hypothetical protein